MGRRLRTGYGREFPTTRNITSVFTRRSLFDTVAGTLETWTPETPGASLLDVGCGAQPYRPLAEEAGFRYTGIDWPASIHAPDSGADVVRCNLNETPWPIPDAAHDCILCTEVLEHIIAPDRLIAECARVLRPGGRILLTAPHVWPEHEAPHDYHRFTTYSLRMYFEAAGFREIDIRPRGGWHLAMAQLLGIWSYDAFPRPWNFLTRLLVLPFAILLANLDGMRGTNTLPFCLGYSVTARRG